MLLPYLLELSKVNACVTRLNYITQNNGGCLCVSSSGNRRTKENPFKSNYKLANRQFSCFICNEYGLHEAPFYRPWSSRYFNRYAPNTKRQRTRLVIVRFFKSGNQPSVAPLYPTKYKCLTKIPEAVNINQDLNKERGLPFDKLQTEMRKIAFKIKKDQWNSKGNVPSPKIHHNYDGPKFKSASTESSKFTGKEWTESNKIIFESESLKNLKKRINRRKLDETLSVKFPISTSVGKFEPEKPPSPHLTVSESNVNENNTQSSDKNDPSSLPSPYFFIKKKFNKEVFTGTHSNPSTIKSETNKSLKDQKKDKSDVNDPHVPSPRLLQPNSTEDYFDDPNLLRRRIDSALKHSFTKKNTLEVLSSVSLSKDSSNKGNKKVSYPSPNLKEYSKLFSFRDEVTQPLPDNFSIKMVSAVKNTKKSSVNIARNKSDLSLRFDNYLRRLDKNIRTKTKALSNDGYFQKEKIKQVLKPSVEKTSKDDIHPNKLNINSNVLKTKELNSTSGKNIVEVTLIPKDIQASPSIVNAVEKQAADSKPQSTEEVIDETKNHPQRVKTNLENTPLLIDTSKNKISSVLKKGIHSKSSDNSAKKDIDTDDFEQWKSITNEEELRNKNLKYNEPHNEEKDKVLHLFSRRIIEVSSPNKRSSDDTKHIVKPILPKEEIIVDDRYNIPPTTYRNQSSYEENALRQKRNISDNRLINTSKFDGYNDSELQSHEPNIRGMDRRENRDDFEYIEKEERQKHSDEPHQKYIQSHIKPDEEMRDSQRHYEPHQKYIQSHRLNRDEEMRDNQIHSEPRMSENEKEPETEAKFEPANWQGNSNRRQAILGQSAPYYPHYSKVETDSKDFAYESERYDHPHQTDDRDIRLIKYHKNIPVEDDKFYENKDNSRMNAYSHLEKEDHIPNYDQPHEENVWRTVKHDRYIGSGDRKRKFESSENQDAYNTDQNNSDISARYAQKTKQMYEQPEGERTPKNPVDKDQIDFTTAGNGSKPNELSDFKGDVFIKMLPASQFIAPNDRNAVSEYDPDPFNEALARKAILNEEETSRYDDRGRNQADRHRNISEDRYGQFSPLPKRSGVYLTKGSLEDGHTNRRNDSIRNQRQSEDEREIRNAKEAVYSIDNTQSRDKEMFDKNELIKQKVKRNRDVFIESEIRERTDNQPFEYTLAEESKKSFEELKKMVKNELIMDRNKSNRANLQENYESFRENKATEHDRKRSLARSYEKQVDIDSPSKSDSGKGHIHSKPEEPTALKSQNRKYLSNSYYHLGKAKSSLERYLENLKLVHVNPDTDSGANGFSSSKTPSEFNFDRSQSKPYPNQTQENAAIKRQNAKSKKINNRISEEERIYKTPMTNLKHDMRHTGHPKYEPDDMYVSKSNKFDTEESVDYEPQHKLRRGQHRWESSEINRAVPKLHQKNSEWYSQYKNRIEPHSMARVRSVDTPSNDGNLPNDSPMTYSQPNPNYPDQNQPSYSQSSHPQHYYSRQVSPSRQTVNPNQNTVSRNPNYIQEHYKEYFNKPNATGAIDTIPPYMQNDAYYYGEEPKFNYSENYSQFKNLNPSNLTQNNNQGGARRNSHTIVSPSPFFSAPEEYNSNVSASQYTPNQSETPYSYIPEYLAPEINYDESTNPNSKRIYSYHQPHGTHNVNYNLGDQGRFMNESTVYPSSYKGFKHNKSFASFLPDEKIKNYNTPSNNYSVGMDQLLSSDENSSGLLKNKYINSFGLSNRPEKFSDSYGNSNMTEPSYVFSKVPAMFNSTSRGFSLLDVPKHLSGYFHKLVKWKNLRDYKYSSSDSVYNLNTEAHYDAKDKSGEVIDMPLTKEARFDKLTKPLTPIINRINKNIDSYYINNSAIPNQTNPLLKVSPARNVTNFNLESDSVSPTMKVSKISLNLKHTLPFFRNKKRKNLPKNKPIVPKKEDNTNVKSEKESSSVTPSEISDVEKAFEEPAINQLSQEQNNSKKKPDESITSEPLNKPSVPNKPTVSLPAQEQKASNQPPLEIDTKKDLKTKPKISNIFKLVRKNYELSKKDNTKKPVPRNNSSKSKPLKVDNPKQNFLSKLMILKPQRKQPISKLQALSLSQKKAKPGQKDFKLITDVAQKSNETHNKPLSVDSGSNLLGRNIGAMPLQNNKSTDQDQTVNHQKAENSIAENKTEFASDNIKQTELAGDVINNAKEGLKDMKLKDNNVDQPFAVVPSKKTRSKIMLNVLKKYANPQRKKNPYKAFSDLYSD